MFYTVLGMIILVSLLPTSVRNQLRFREESVIKRARSLGIEMSFNQK